MLSMVELSLISSWPIKSSSVTPERFDETYSEPKVSLMQQRFPRRQIDNYCRKKSCLWWLAPIFLWWRWQARPAFCQANQHWTAFTLSSANVFKRSLSTSMPYISSSTGFHWECFQLKMVQLTLTILKMKVCVQARFWFIDSLYNLKILFEISL